MDWPTSLSISVLSVKSWFSRLTGWRRSMPGSLSMRYNSSAACTGGQYPCRAHSLMMIIIIIIIVSIIIIINDDDDNNNNNHNDDDDDINNN